MRRIRKKYKKPFRPWDKERIEEEKKVMKKYGLRRKKEIWKAGAILRNFRRRAREIAAKNDKEGERILLDKLYNLGIFESREVKLDDVLDLKIDNILSRRLQTLVFEKKLSNTILQARQLIVHGHIAVDGRRTTFPSYLVPREKEDKIGYYGGFEPKINQKPSEQLKESGE